MVSESIAAHGSGYIGMTRNGPFDLYVLDVLMPGMRGTELARRLRAAVPGAKILYCTGYDCHLFKQQPVLPENEAFIQKPISTREIAETVSLLLFGHTRGPDKVGDSILTVTAPKGTLSFFKDSCSSFVLCPNRF
jgi:DNA-binding NarL/FixJ family response regulator